MVFVMNWFEFFPLSVARFILPVVAFLFHQPGILM